MGNFMNDTVLVAIIGAVAGIIGGTIASLIAPWINWGIKKNKFRLEERKKLLEDIRTIIINEYEEHEKFTKELALDPEITKTKKYYPTALTYYDTLNKHSQFQRIIPFIPEENINLLKNSKLLSLKDRGSALGEMPLPYENLMKSLSEIENKWKLI